MTNMSHIGWKNECWTF